MITERTLKYVKETINHPYVGIKILPMVGDFCGHATNTAKALLRDEVITTDTFYGLTELINGIEKHQKNSDIDELISIFRYHAGW